MRRSVLSQLEVPFTYVNPRSDGLKLKSTKFVRSLRSTGLCEWVPETFAAGLERLRGPRSDQAGDGSAVECAGDYGAAQWIVVCGASAENLPNFFNHYGIAAR